MRAPRAGKVKTRLAAGIGDATALAVYRRLAEHAVACARSLEGVELRVHHTPAEAGEEVRAWLGGGPRYLPQEGGGLGERMARAFADAFAGGAERVAIVGSDLPGLTPGLLARAFAALEAAEAVVGPAADGGYYLLGLTRPVPGLFDGIAWSTSEVLPATLRRLHDAGIRPLLLETLADVDEARDLPPGWLPPGAAEDGAGR